jgi:hypothetical protein
VAQFLKILALNYGSENAAEMQGGYLTVPSLLLAGFLRSVRFRSAHSNAHTPKPSTSAGNAPHEPMSRKMNFQRRPLKNTGKRKKSSSIRVMLQGAPHKE